MLLPEKGYKRILVLSFYVILTGFVIYMFAKYLLSPLLCFSIAFGIANLTRPIVDKISKVTGISKKLASICVSIILISLLGLLVYFACSRLFKELVQLGEFATNGGFDKLSKSISSSINNVLVNLSKFEFADRFIDNFQQKSKIIENIIIDSAKSFVPKILQKLIDFLKLIPGAILFTALTFIATFYAGSDYDNINAFLSAQFSQKTFNTIRQIKAQFVSVGCDLFKAYFLITLITFTELLAGFATLDIPYSGLLALLISIVDMLPILGTGTVLVPWALICLLINQKLTAIGLLVLYGIITVVRQIAEPKIVGASIGLHPLATLIAMYCGLKTIGFWGLFTFPIIVMVLKSLNDKGVIQIYRTPKQTQIEMLNNSKSKYSKFKLNDSHRHNAD